jgi:plastocyanin
MRPLIHPCAFTIAVLFLASCAEGNSPTAVRPGTASPTVGVSASGAAGRLEISLNIMDACDAATFNAAVGPGTCIREGGMKFAQFVAELTRHQEAGAWHFAPPAFQASIGQTIEATNRGGETHTFTHVAAFGGGIVPFLNTLSGNPKEAPECKALAAKDFVPPGGTFPASLPHAGAQKFQCCIHPWMRATAEVQ